MHSVSLRALSVGYLASARLAAAREGMLPVHSAFRQTLNVQLDDGQLLPLISAGSSSNHPDALRVQVPESWDWRQPVSIKLEGSRLITRRWHCAVNGLPVWQPAPPPSAEIPSQTLTFLHAQLRVWCQQQDVASVLKLLPDDNFGVPVTITFHDSDERLAAMVDRVIGFGGGLTPDGDDYLLGYFAALNVSPRPDITLHRQRLAVAVEPRLSRTNDISRHYLGRAVQGHFSESLCRLMAELSAPFCPPALATCATGVMAFGAASGADCMAGFLHGLRNLNNALAH
jgi:Protein of unknown function (DUF2877)